MLTRTPGPYDTPYNVKFDRSFDSVLTFINDCFYRPSMITWFLVAPVSPGAGRYNLYHLVYTMILQSRTYGGLDICARLCQRGFDDDDDDRWWSLDRYR